MFSFPLSAGNPSSALREPNEIVLTPKSAAALFGEADPVGQTVEYFRSELERTGRVDSADRHCHRPGAAAPLDDPVRVGRPVRGAQRRHLRRSGQLGQSVAPNVRASRARIGRCSVRGGHAGSDGERRSRATPTTAFGASVTTCPSPSPTCTSRSTGMAASSLGKRRSCDLFGLIALAVLIIAVLNYVNLATARGLRMAREVGVRKAVGAGRGQVARQTARRGAAAGVARVRRRRRDRAAGAAAVQHVLRQEKSCWAGTRLPVWAGALVLMLDVGLLAGAYPALVLSRFDPARVLKSGPSGAIGGTWLRRGLVVAQFAATIGLLVFTASSSGNSTSSRTATNSPTTRG